MITPLDLDSLLHSLPDPASTTPSSLVLSVTCMYFLDHQVFLQTFTLYVNINNLVIPAGGRDGVTSPAAFSAPGWTNPGVSASPVLQPPVHLGHLCQTRCTLSVSCLYWVYKTGNTTPYVVLQWPSRGEGSLPSSTAALLLIQPRTWLHSLLQGHTADLHSACCPPFAVYLTAYEARCFFTGIFKTHL